MCRVPASFELSTVFSSLNIYVALPNSVELSGYVQIFKAFSMDDTTEETAYHECGHAFMAVRLGGVVRHLTIEPPRDDGPDRFGEVQVAWQRQGQATREFHNKLVLVALAGPVAEMIYRGEPLHPGFVAEWSSDWATAWQAAEPIMPDTKKRLAFLEEAVRQVHALFSRDEHWAAIAALSDNLLAHETLEEPEIQDILDAWT